MGKNRLSKYIAENEVSVQGRFFKKKVLKNIKMWYNKTIKDK